jgi:hypothetical protein
MHNPGFPRAPLTSSKHVRLWVSVTDKSETLDAVNH